MDKQIGTEPPYTKGRFDTIDYLITTRRWRNSFKNAYTDIHAGIDTDHYPLIAEVHVNLKANYRPAVQRHKYVQCTDEQRQGYNTALSDNKPANPNHANITEWIKSIGENNIIKKIVTRHPFELSNHTLELMEEKRKEIQEGKTDTEITDLRRAVTRSIRADKRRHTAGMVNKDIDERDLYMGLRHLRKAFVAVPLGMKDKTGKHVHFKDRAQKAAEFLGTEIWGKQDNDNSEQPRTPLTKIVNEDLQMNTDEVTLQEIIWAIKKLKRMKAAGPDTIPIEFFKELDTDNLEIIRTMINEWWNGVEIPEEVTQANVILLYKKGDKNNLANYRPISLLNSIYKILTAILQKRISTVLEKYLQRTQYGFRQKRGTAQAIHYIRRVIEKGESTRTNTKTLLVLLDWEKAFDKVIHKELFNAMSRMNIPDKIINIIKQLYKKPIFRVEM